MGSSGSWGAAWPIRWGWGFSPRNACATATSCGTSSSWWGVPATGSRFSGTPPDPLAPCGVPHHPQVLPIPRRRNALARRVGTRLIHPRADAQLALLADVPVLAVGAVPELLGIADVVARRRRRVGIHQPLTHHARLQRRLGPHRVE